MYPSRVSVRFPHVALVAQHAPKRDTPGRVWRGPMRAHMSGIARIRPRVSRVPVIVPTGCPVGSRGTRPVPSALSPVPPPRPARSFPFPRFYSLPPPPRPCEISDKSLGKHLSPANTPFSRREASKSSLSIYLFLK